MSRVGKSNLSSTFLRLRGDASVEPIPVDDGFWSRLAAGEFGSFHNEFLISFHEFRSNWPNWEKHPKGDEVVCLLSGSVTFALETEEEQKEVELTGPGDFLVVPRGVWHTARVNAPSRMLFITAGEGTESRGPDTGPA